MWIAIALLALMLAAGSGSGAPPLPDAPPRCAELVIDDAWVAQHRDRISRALADLNARPPTDPAVPALISMMQTIAPECDWTPSTTTDLVGLDGKRVRFDEVVRALQGVSLVDAGAIVGDLRGNTIVGEGMSPAPRSLLEATLAVLPPVIVEPPRPKPPIPTPDGPVGQGAPPMPPPAKCTRMRADGPATVCLVREPSGAWKWTWSHAGDELVGEAGSSSDATILAYRDAAERYAVPWVVREPVARGGVRLEPDGELTVFDSSAWGLATHRRLSEQFVQGERDPMGLVLAALQLVFPQANWFRIRPTGGLDAAAARVDNVIRQAASPGQTPPDVVDRIARAIVGVGYDATDHVFRGRRVRLRSTSNGFATTWSYQIDNGGWLGSYATEQQALAAAHGGGG